MLWLAQDKKDEKLSLCFIGGPPHLDLIFVLYRLFGIFNCSKMAFLLVEKIEESEEGCLY